MKKCFALILALVMVFSLSACGKKEASSLLKKETLIVGICADYPPFESLDDAGNLVGFDVDIANYIAQHIEIDGNKGLKIEFSQMDFSNIISALQMDQVDVGIAAFSYNPERQCSFSKPYYSSAQVVVVRDDSEFTDYNQLIDGYKIVAGEGTVGYDIACETFTGSEVSNGGGSYQVQFEMVAQNQQDAIVADVTVAQHYVDNGGFKIIGTLSTDELCVTAKQGNDKLVEAVNAVIDAMMADGTYEALREKWGC